MRVNWSRRRVVAGSGASLLALGLAQRAAAQGGLAGQLGQVLDGAVPRSLRAILPAGPFEILGFVRSVIALEGEARALNLPASALSVREDTLPLDPDSLYLMAMPRLVALVDRGERINLAFADQAGDLLAQLHHSQYVTPEGLGNLLSRASAPAKDALAFAEQEQVEPLPVPDIPLPPAPDVVSEPVIQQLPEGNSPPPSAPPAAVASVPTSLSRSIRFGELSGEYAAMFAAAAIRPEREEQTRWHLTMMRQSRSRYAALGERAGVPWQFIAAIHGMEASFNFRAHLHNGDFPLQQRTRQVPAGRPLRWLPPSDWESSAMDALRLLGFAGQSDWSLPRTLYRLEAYNGFGYRRMARPSPYLWSFTTNYDRGKFVADGHFDPRARSQQCGAATMLKLLELAGELDLTA